MKKIALILSGCGHQDGSEITETVSVIISLSQFDAQMSFFSPSAFLPTINHINQQPQEPRSPMVEAARITRGQIADIKNLTASDFDALILPGGQGAISVLSNWKEKKSKARLDTEVQRVILDFYNQGKPMGAICIAPVLLALALKNQDVTLTLGQDLEVSKEIEKLGCYHESCDVEDYITDRAHKIVSTPAYMDDNAKPYQIFKGISGLVKEIVEMA